TYGFGVATTYRTAAKKLGITVAGFEGWDAKASSYEALATRIKASGAQAVFLGGIICNNGAKLMQDIKAVDPKIQLQMPDGFSDEVRLRAHRLQRHPGHVHDQCERRHEPDADHDLQAGW